MATVELISERTPIRHALVHQVKESLGVIAFQQVSEFVDDDVLKALGCLLGEFKVEPDSVLVDFAGAPFGFHPLDGPRWGGDTEKRCPLLDERGDLQFERSRYHAMRRRSRASRSVPAGRVAGDGSYP